MLRKTALLGLQAPWSVTNVELNVEKLRVDIHAESVGSTGVCPDCRAFCRLYDEAAERTWRHLDTMPFETFLHAKIPRIKCTRHGIKNANLPRVGKHSRFTLLFEAFALRVLQAARSNEEACKLRKHQVEAFKKRVVERGLACRKKSLIPYVGLDEKSFRKGMSFVTALCDLEGAHGAGQLLQYFAGALPEDADNLIKTADRQLGRGAGRPQGRSNIAAGVKDRNADGLADLVFDPMQDFFDLRKDVFNLHRVKIDKK